MYLLNSQDHQVVNVPFNNIRILKFNPNQQFACFTAVNHNYSDKRLTAIIQKPTEWIEIRQSQHGHDLCTPLSQTLLFSKRSAIVIDGEKCWLYLDIRVLVLLKGALNGFAQMIKGALNLVGER